MKQVFYFVLKSIFLPKTQTIGIYKLKIIFNIMEANTMSIKIVKRLSLSQTFLFIMIVLFIMTMLSSLIILSSDATAAVITKVSIPIVKINNKNMNFKKKAFIAEKNSQFKMGTPMLPIESIARSLIYKTSLNKKKMILTITRPKSTFKAVIDLRKALIIMGNNPPIPGGIIPKYKNGAVYVTPAYIEKILGVTCDWWRDSKVASIYTKSKKATLYQRIMSSGEWKVIYISRDKQETDVASKDENIEIKIHFAKSFNCGNPYRANCSEASFSTNYYDLKNRRKAQELIKLAYPTEYIKVYHLYMLTLREEIYQSFSSDNEPGVMNLVFDNRNISILKVVFGISPCTGFSIGFKNQKYIDTPSPIIDVPQAKSGGWEDEIKFFKLKDETWY